MASLPPSAIPGFNVYTTLLTRPSYLAGAILLSHTLHIHSPSTPLIILYTPETFPASAVKALEAESKYSHCIPYQIDHLRLPTTSSDDGKDHGMVAERFIDTWTKLRVFDILEVNGKKIDRICFLDADMMIFSNPSPLIFNAANDEYLSAPEGQGNRIGASHVCVCNLDGDSWAPPSWKKENCAFTSLTSSDEIAPTDPNSDTKGIFNSGTFVFHPSPSIRSFVLDAFNNTPVKDLRKLKFPDQDFLNIVFNGRWASLSWRINALKTWRYWHTNIWADDQVAVLHYIVDKPWAARVQTMDDKGTSHKVAGYKGDDGETHSWWWDEFARWKAQREEQHQDHGLVAAVGRYVAGEKGDEEVDDDMKAIGGGAQDFAKKWKDGKEVGGGSDENKDPEKGTHGPVLRKPVLGERGHGPVVRTEQFPETRPRKTNIPPTGSSYMEP